MARSETGRESGIGAGALHGAWRLVLLLALAVVVPTVCVLYFMSQAVRNARLAVRQKLADAYQPQLAPAADELAAYWQGKLAALRDVYADGPAAVTFAQLVTSRVCDTAIIYNQSGDVAYPTAAPGSEEGIREEPDDWAEARRIEYDLAHPADAAEAYAELAERTDDVNLTAGALLAHARCLAKAN